MKTTAKIGGPFETAKRNLLKDVKGFEKVRFTLYQTRKVDAKNSF